MAIDPDLEELAQLFDQVVHGTSQIIWVFSPEGDELVYISDGYEELWGRSREALAADAADYLEGVHPEDRPRLRETIETATNGESADVEYRVVTPQDEERWVWTHSTPVRDDGEIVGIAGFTREVTDRKRRERELQRYETILESLPDTAFVFDADGVCVYANQTAVESAGPDVTRADLLGQTLVEMLEFGPALDDADEVMAGFEKVIEGETDHRRATSTFEFDGERVYVDVRTTRVESPDGEFLGVVSVLRDITDRVEAIEALDRQNERLDEFVSVVSHDLRNPLNVARGRLDLARAECESSHLEDVDRALDRMETLVDDLLTLARDGTRIRALEPVDLATVARTSWQSVETPAATLVTDVSATVPADVSRLQQLFENLFRNSVEHGSTSNRSAEHSDDAVEHGDPDVTVTVGALPDGAGFYVADDGRGIPESERAAVFEPGYSTLDGGTGFGLSIVEEIAEAHGWSVAVTESDAGGARFEFTGVDADDGGS